MAVDISGIDLSPLLNRENYPGDREYTFNTLVEELSLMERHIRDGSWRLCSCNPEKHLPLIAGLSSEGYIFAKSPQEKEFMAKVRDKARQLKREIGERVISGEEGMDGVAKWARDVRHRVEARDWTITPQFDFPIEKLGEEPMNPAYQERLETKNLNVDEEHSRGRVEKMVSWKDAVAIDGVVLASEGGKRLIDMVAPAQYADWAKIGIGAVAQVGAILGKLRSPWDLYLVIAGANMVVPGALAKVEEMVAPAARVAITEGMAQMALPSYVVTSNRTVEAVPVGTAPISKYVVTG